MKKLFLVLLVALVSCKDNSTPDACGVSDPMTELEWLKNRAAEIEKSDLGKYFYITQADYNGQTIFYVNNCCPMCSTIIIYYDCSGNQIEGVDPSQVKNQKRIWTPSNFECVFYD